MTLEWEECDKSGRLIANGDIGQYWIDEQAWTYLTLVTTDFAGINQEKIGTFNTVDDAKEYAEAYDSKRLDDSHYEG